MSHLLRSLLCLIGFHRWKVERPGGSFFLVVGGELINPPGFACYYRCVRCDRTEPLGGAR